MHSSRRLPEQPLRVHLPGGAMRTPARLQGGGLPERHLPRRRHLQLLLLGRVGRHERPQEGPHPHLGPRLHHHHGLRPHREQLRRAGRVSFPERLLGRSAGEYHLQLPGGIPRASDKGQGGLLFRGVFHLGVAGTSGRCVPGAADGPRPRGEGGFQAESVEVSVHFVGGPRNPGRVVVAAAAGEPEVSAGQGGCGFGSSGAEADVLC